MKKTLAVLLAVFLVTVLTFLHAIVFMAPAYSELCGYSVCAESAVSEADTPSDFFVAYMMKVKPDWEKVYRESEIFASVSLPFHSDFLHTAVLTDGFSFVRGRVAHAEGHTVCLAFETGMIRAFKINYGYLAFVCAIGE